MTEDILTQHRRWFRFFPEGSLEFLIVTRVLALFLLLSLMILQQTQRPIILVGLVGMLWVDYALTVLWVVQMAMDLALLAGQRGSALPVGSAISGAEMFEQSRYRRRLIVLILLPSVAAAAALAPWPVFLQTLIPAWRGGVPSVVLRLSRPVAGVVFIVLVVTTQYAMRKIGLGPSLWTVLLMIPLVHWLALHRVVVDLEHRIDMCRHGQQTGDGGKVREGPPLLAANLADATWVLMMLPWLGLVAWIVLRGGWPAVFPQRMLPFCGVLLAAVFAVADLAALERLQRHFVNLLAHAAPPERS